MMIDRCGYIYVYLQIDIDKGREVDFFEVIFF